MTNQFIFRNGCWTCKRALEDPQEKYTCPRYKQHLEEYNLKVKW